MLNIHVQSLYCPGCAPGDGIVSHICGVGSTTWGTYSLWNGPICPLCKRGYIGRHDCDMEIAPCPDDVPGCLAMHLRHRKREA